VTQTGRYHGGLVFFGAQDNALDRFSRIVTATLEDYGHPVERQSILNPQQARIVSSHYLVKLSLGAAPMNLAEVDAPGKSLQRLELLLCPVADRADDRDISELILVMMLYRMVDLFTTRQIEWLDPGMVLSVDQFLGAFDNASPRRLRGRQETLETGNTPFSPVDETELGLAMRFDNISGKVLHDAKPGLIDLSEEETLAFAYHRSPPQGGIDVPSPEEEAQNDIRRLAAWGMTGMVGFLCAPVALSMAAVNLVKGEDFRLNTNVLSLTGLLVMLQSSGALASAMSYLPI